MATYLNEVRSAHKNTQISSKVLTAQKFERDIAVHIEDGMISELIHKARPNESKQAKEYRNQIWQSITRQYFTGVIMSLQKIRKSEDYIWKWDPQTEPINVAADEQLRIYTEFDYPVFGSFDNWYWGYCFRAGLLDGNAVSVIWPDNIDRMDNEYYRPTARIFNSKQIRRHEIGKLLIVKSDEEAFYQTSGRTYPAAVYYSIDTETITRYVQTSSGYDPSFSVTEFVHGLGRMPVVSLRGEVKDYDGKEMLCVSRLYGMVPYLNEAMREYSDMQLEVIQHIHSTLWTIQGHECNTCKGVGTRLTQEGAVNCPECKGKGYYPMNPGEAMVIRLPGPGENQIPTPPAGFIQKDIEIAKLQNERILSHIYNAYSSINFEWKMNVPMSQSGIAKQFDRAEFANFVYTVAEDAIRQIDEHLSIIADYRYNQIVTDPMDRRAMLPTIGVPVKYDMLPEQLLVNEISSLRAAKVSPSIINAAEIDYANKKFSTDVTVRDRVKAAYEIDPYAGVAEEDMMSRLTNGVISKAQYYLHANINYLLDEAIEGIPNFMQQPLVMKRDLLLQMAEQELMEMLPSSRVMAGVPEPPQQPDQPMDYEDSPDEYANGMNGNDNSNGSEGDNGTS